MSKLPNAISDAPTATENGPGTKAIFIWDGLEQTSVTERSIFMDNLNIKGIESDVSPGKFKARGKRRKPYIIESRLTGAEGLHPRNVFHSLKLEAWWVRSRYTTATRRDQAYAALVKKERNSYVNWANWHYRKVDPA